MNQAIKLGRYTYRSQSSTFSSLSGLFSTSSRKRAGTVRLLQQVAGGNDIKQPNFYNMDKQMKSSDHDDNNIMSVMEESFGLKYATRCEDEGFGGIYGSNEECNESVMESFGLRYTTRCDDEGFGGIYGSNEEHNGSAMDSLGSKYTTRCDDEGFGGIYGSNEESNRSVMEESFGSKYTTRCDDEGFGGIYGSKEEGNTEIKNIKIPAHRGSNQGSEVKEKEHAQNQREAAEKV